MSITNCDTHLTRTVRYLSLTFEPVYLVVRVLFFNRFNASVILVDFKASVTKSFVSTTSTP